MFERFTPAARNVLQKAVDAARELQHPAVGTEHLLLGMTDPASGATAEILREAAVDRERVVAEIGRLRANPPAFRNLADAEALRSIGIDLDAVIAAVEQSFGPGALYPALCPAPPPRRLTLRVRLRRLRPSFLRRRLVRWRNRRRDARSGAGVPVGALPFVPSTKEVLELSLRESLRLQHDHVGSEHLLLGLLREGNGLAAHILVRAGLTIADLRERTLRSLGRPA
jgi:ATP-dependent Clp protease ATP-binding subunit ClpA